MFEYNMYEKKRKIFAYSKNQTFPKHAKLYKKEKR